VGGGFTGLWTALEVLRARRSASVVVLEAARCGDGASGRNGGFLHGYWASLPRLRDLFGAEAAVALAREATGVYDAVRALGEDLWLVEGGMLAVAIGPAHEAELERAAAVAAEVGAPEEAVLVDRGDFDVRSPAFRRAVRYRDCATVQPARLVRALRRAALAAGARVHERTTVLGIDGSTVRAAGGSVRAEEIVLATNASAAAGWPLARRVAVFRSAIVLTEPVPDLHDRLGWRGGEAIADERTYLSYFRATHDGRVLMGSPSGRSARASSAARSSRSTTPRRRVWRRRGGRRRCDVRPSSSGYVSRRADASPGQPRCTTLRMFPSGSLNHAAVIRPLVCTSPSRSMSGMLSYCSNETPRSLSSTTAAATSSTSHEAAVAWLPPANPDAYTSSWVPPPHW